MRTDTNVQPIEPPYSFPVLLDIFGNPTPALAGRIPQTLRDNVSARPFCDFGTVLMAEKPVSADLSSRVQRWRTIDAASHEHTALQAHPDQIAENRRLRLITAITVIAIAGWLTIGVLVAAFAGRL